MKAAIAKTTDALGPIHNPSYEPLALPLPLPLLLDDSKMKLGGSLQAAMLVDSLGTTLTVKYSSGFSILLLSEVNHSRSTKRMVSESEIHSRFPLDFQRIDAILLR